MKPLKGHVRNGQIVLDEAMSLPDGTAVEITAEPVGDDYEMTPEEQAELDEAIAESDAQIARGETTDAREFLKELRARHEGGTHKPS